jgi:undecaprenyl-diphosphatase
MDKINKFFITIDSKSSVFIESQTWLPRNVLKFFSINPKVLYLLFILIDYWLFSSNFILNIIAMIVMDIVIWIAKRVIRRRRPHYENQDIISLVTGIGTDAYSFPSSHSFTAFQFVPLSYFMFGPIGLLIILYSFTVALSRLSLKHHHFTDVVAGGLLGLVIAFINLSVI